MFCQIFKCKIIYSLLQLVHTEIFPCLWLNLLSRVCPEITVVEIQKHSKACICNLFSDSDSLSQVIVTRTVRLTLL